MASKDECEVKYPPLDVVDRAVAKLKELYPKDLIQWKGGGREQVMQAIASAKWAFYYAEGLPCGRRKLAAAATLFYLHPLVDGNKRLTVLILAAFLFKNGLPTPKTGDMYVAALKVASGEWKQDDVYSWLLGVYETKGSK